MADFIKSELEALGVTVRLVPLGKHVLDGQEIDLPPAILASIGNDPKKKTVGLYAHYDVQPVRLCLLWVELAHRLCSHSRNRPWSPMDGTQILSFSPSTRGQVVSSAAGRAMTRALFWAGLTSSRPTLSRGSNYPST